MGLSILTTHKYLQEALIVNPNRGIQSDSIDRVYDIFEDSPPGYSCRIWATAQALNKLANSKSLSIEQVNRMLGVFRSEGSTQGMDGFNPDSSTYESALTLSYLDFVVVLALPSEVEKIDTNPRIRVMTGEQFCEAETKAKNLFKAMGSLLDRPYIDFLCLALFHPRTISRVLESATKSE